MRNILYFHLIFHLARSWHWRPAAILHKEAVSQATAKEEEWTPNSCQTLNRNKIQASEKH